MTESAFKRWRKQMGYSQAQAAKALGVTPRYVKALDTGVSHNTGEPIKMSDTLRLLMAALAERGSAIEPWPER